MTAGDLSSTPAGLLPAPVPDLSSTSAATDRYSRQRNVRHVFFSRNFYLKKGGEILVKFCRACPLLGVEVSYGSGALRGVRLKLVALPIALSVTLNYQFEPF